jgi:hypothetical protein
MLRCSPAVLAALSLTAFACGKGKAPGACEHNFDCAAGQACVSGACQVVPCGGCQPDEACGNDGQCVAAQGVSCADHTCPAAYPCNGGGVCSKPCTLNQDCDSGFFCNSSLKSCTECAFNTQCESKPGKPVCDTSSGTCVPCNVNFDCVKALGSGHFCDAHACKPGCKADPDCNAGLGETCDTSTSPGKCIQCHVNADCAAQGPSASACDDTGHCVQCWGADQASANTFCGAGTPECNLANKSCVQCLTANNQCGNDCGYLNNGVNGTAWGCASTNDIDPHNAQTCDGSTFSCLPGCQFDSQCGCPHNVLPGYQESACDRFPDQEHCDPKRTTMAGVTGATQGACVQCTDNTHCEYKIHGTALYGGQYATFNGSRCASDSCVEGCDTSDDCYPNHQTPAQNPPKICHVGVPGDANSHKCVECQCDVLSADGTYCEVKTDGSPACTNTAGGSPRVCDSASLKCRLKHEGEECSASNECGALVDPANGSECPALPGFCALQTNNEATNKFCSPSHGLPGRCAANAGSCTCPPGSTQRQASNTESGSNQVCFPSSCSY